MYLIMLGAQGTGKGTVAGILAKETGWPQISTGDIFRKNIIIPLITPSILGTYFHFHTNKTFFEEILNLDSQEKYDAYIKNELTKHIQHTIKSLLLYEI